MSTLQPTTADVINAVNETLELLCRVRGVPFDDLDESMIDRLLLSSFREYLGERPLLAPSSTWAAAGWRASG